MLFLQHDDTQKMFDVKGGDGYSFTKDPHPQCPECGGIGTEQAYFKDVRTLSPDAVALYAGVKQTRHGIEILIRSKTAAIDQAARFLGMNKQTIDLVGITKAKDLTDDELTAIATGATSSTT